MADVVVRLDDIWKIFGANPAAALADARAGASKADLLRLHGAVVGVAGVSLEVRAGELFCIMGLSGSGKSTLLRHVNRLIAPTAGSVSVLGEDVLALRPGALRRLRSERIGMVFQHVALLPHRSVRDNVSYPLALRGEPVSVQRRVATEKLALVGLSGHEDRMPRELSGGMQQRVGLARALASDPDVLLMDEPFSALDPLIRRQLQEQFLHLSRTLAKTTLFITHDLDEATRIGSRIAIMKDGQIIQIGTAEQIIAAPADDYVRAFVRDVSKMKMVRACDIMEPLDEVRAAGPFDAGSAASAPVTADLHHLIDLSAATAWPVLIRDGEGGAVGAVTKNRLLAAIRDGR